MSIEAERRADILLSGFEEWTAARGIDADLFVVEAIIDWRLDQRGDPAVLGPDEVRVLLTAWFPRKVTLDRPELPGVLTAMRHWVDFLAHETGLREPAAVLAAIDRHAGEFTERMTDERNFGIAKFWVSRMLAHGVDTEDQSAVQRFIDAVRAGGVDYDREVLAEIVRRQAAEEAEPQALPSVTLWPEPELAELAAGSALVVRFRTLVEWLGAGRALTSAGRLRVADGRELAALLGVDGDRAASVRGSGQLPTVTLLVEWARAARLVRVVKGRLVPVKSAAGLLQQPLDLWRRVCLAFGDVGGAACLPPSQAAGAPLLGPVLSEVAFQLWLALYSAAGEDVPVELLVGVIVETVADIYCLDVSAMLADFRETLWRGDLDGVLASLAVVGVIETTVSDDEGDRGWLAELSGRPDPDPTFARLTPLGLWAAREVLTEAGLRAG